MPRNETAVHPATVRIIRWLSSIADLVFIANALSWLLPPSDMRDGVQSGLLTALLLTGVPALLLTWRILHNRLNVGLWTALPWPARLIKIMMPLVMLAAVVIAPERWAAVLPLGVMLVVTNVFGWLRQRNDLHVPDLPETGGTHTTSA